MSRLQARKPVFRLVLSHPDFRVEIDGATVETIPTEAPGRDARLAALARRIAAGNGRLVVVLPESEVWRARFAGRTGTARLRAAAEAALGSGDIAVALGPADPNGRGLAAVRRSTLEETHAFLAASGLRVDAIIGGGSFPGFKAAPEFAAGRRPLSMVLPVAFPPAPAAAGIATMAAVLVTLALQPSPPPVVALPAPVAAVSAPLPAVAAAAPRAEDIAAVAPQGPPQVRPRARPADLVVLAARPPALPAPAGEPGLRPVVPVAFAARNLPPEVQAAAAGMGTATATRVAVLLADGSPPVPRQRPREATREAALPTATDAVPAGSAIRPRARPALTAAATRPAALPGAGRAADAPRPRPSAGVSDAALAAAIGAAVADVQTSAPARVAALAPEPRRPVAQPARPATAARAPAAAAPAPARVVATPAPARVVAAPARVVAAPAPTRAVAAPAPARVVAAPAPARAVAAPAPVRTVRAAPAPARTATRSEPARPGSVSLIGVFGKADQRHALLRLGNGSTERVRTGDRVAGVQVAAIGADSVRLAGGGRDTVLRLPE